MFNKNISHNKDSKNPLFHRLINHIKNMSNITQLCLLLAVTAALAVFFYNVPETNPVNSSGASASGIGGGSIVGDCMVGKKALPIYCVDVESKNKSAHSNSATEQSSATSQNASESQSTSQTQSASQNQSTSQNQRTSQNQSTSEPKYISLSFDAAWGADDTIEILDILDKHNIKVTFFMTGGWVESFPDMVKEIYSRGHDLGNHSQNHKHMSKLSVSEQISEIDSVTKSVKELTGYEMFLFRPPYGDYDSTLVKTIYGCNYYPIQWSVDSLDWKDYGVENIIKTVTKHKALDNGAIILMHNGAKYTAKALDETITKLKEQDYTLVPISELIIKQNFHMDGTGKQIAD